MRVPPGKLLRMLKYFLLVGLLIPNPESQAADLCSPQNHCAVAAASIPATAD